MSQTFKDLMLSLACTYCNAKPGQPCLTRSGFKTASHAARYYLAREMAYGQPE